MDQKTYDKIKAFVRRHVIPSLQDELEDITQYVAMRVFKNHRSNWKWCLADWFKENGYGARGKAGARVMKSAVFVGLGADEETGDCEHLLDTTEVKDFAEHSASARCTAEEKLDENMNSFLEIIGCNGDTIEWAKKTMKKSMSINRLRSSMKDDPQLPTLMTDLESEKL